MNKFQGFNNPYQNWSKLPHQLIEALPKIETIGEMKVIIYTLRHTWGYQDNYKKITLDEFENGRKHKDGTRVDNGTGLSKPTIVNGIKRAIAHGFLFEHTDITDLARVKKFYSLTSEGLKDLTPDVKRFNTGGKEVLHRSEKETIKKETLDNSSAKISQSNGSGFDNADTTEKENLNYLADQIATLCQVDIDLASAKTRDGLKSVTLALYSKSISSADLKSFSNWWYNEYWAGKKGQPPTPSQVGDTWGQFETSKEKPQMTPNHTYTPNLSDAKRKRLAELIAENEAK